MSQVDSVVTLFNKVLEQALAKQHSLEKVALQLQDVDTGIESLWKIVNEIEEILPLKKIAMSDSELKENIELCQV